MGHGRDGMSRPHSRCPHSPELLEGLFSIVRVVPAQQGWGVTPLVISASKMALAASPGCPGPMYSQISPRTGLYGILAFIVLPAPTKICNLAHACVAGWMLAWTRGLGTSAKGSFYVDRRSSRTRVRPRLGSYTFGILTERRREAPR